jgi:hypothetical protein
MRFLFSKAWKSEPRAIYAEYINDSGHSELNDLATTIQSASSQGRLAQFFNSTDITSTVKYHTQRLDSMVAMLTVS